MWLDLRALQRAGLLTLVAGAASAVSCANPTTIHLSVYTDVACSTGAVAAVVGGATLTDLASKAPASTSTQCAASPDGTNTLGDIVLLPSGDKSAEIAFEVMIRPDGAPADGCDDDTNAPNCIVARREIHFAPYTEIDMRIDLRLSCLGIVCDPSSTCDQGQCVPAATTCTGNNCNESGLLPAGGGASHFARVAGGATHTCAITATNGVKCWGENAHGEVGDGTETQRNAPVDVTGLQSGIISLVTGQNFTCALTTARTVKCWGKNDFGELGNNQNTDSSTPVDVQGLTNVTSIAAGCKHVCASLDSGAVQCWGWNDQGQVGDGDDNNVSVPTAAQNVSGASFVTAGFHSSCAAIASGAQCWGDDSMGELGDGLQNSEDIPVADTQLPFGPTVMASGAYHGFAYAYEPAGSPLFASWGENPSTGGLTTAITAASAGDNYTCVLQNGAVFCWGANDSGQLGRGATSGTPDPNSALVQGLTSGVTAIGAGFDHACAFIGQNHLQCWGTNGNGQLGNNTTNQSAAPVDVIWP